MLALMAAIGVFATGGASGVVSGAAIAACAGIILRILWRRW
jgi:pseudouridine-5'-phosphate glycosidase